MNRQLFILGPEIWSSATPEDIKETAKAMADAGIYNYPYDEFDIHAVGQSEHIMKWIFNVSEEYHNMIGEIERGRMVPFRFRYYNCSGDRYAYSMGINMNGHEIFLPHHSEELASLFPSLDKETSDYLNDAAADSILATLLVLLATRNIDKETLDNPKRYKDPESKNGVKQIRNHDYRYVTTIKIGKITETMGGGANRGPVRPHLRRGHIRNQRIGEGRKETKQVFIQPVFVNADEKWIENQRQEYRIKL